ncbi:MAG: glucose-6-phosphate isomerase [Acidaminococcaceae bacterium]
MNLTGKITLPSGFCFDYRNMLGTKRIQPEDLVALTGKIKKATDGVATIRSAGTVAGHLSKDGSFEPVYFTRMPFIKDGNPNTPDSIRKMQAFSKHVWQTTEVVIFLGIGGSYQGNKVLFDVQTGEYWNQQKPLERKGYPKVYFSGNNLDADQSSALLAEITRQAEYKKFAGQGKTSIMLIPISKSGTTIEPTAAFLYCYEQLQAQADLFTLDVTVVTDLSTKAPVSPLWQLAQEYGWTSFDIKEGIGGRFCVFSDPGLITAAVVGMDIEALLAGAQDMELACQSTDLAANPALLNAVLKYVAAEQYGCEIEVLMPYAMQLKSLGEWYVQLLAESLGKRHNRAGVEINYGRTPIAAVGTTDMHAQTQQHQDGKRNKVVQFVELQKNTASVIVGKPFPQVPFFAQYQALHLDVALRSALEANAQALSEDCRFNANYQLPQLDAYYIGQLLYFLMLSIAYEGALANVDAYDQPGVEAYKKIMKAKLGSN